MAHYEAIINSPWNVEEAFRYMADLRNFVEWDPGVSSAEMVVGDEPGPGTAYLLKVGVTELRYETKEFDPPSRIVVEAVSNRLRSYDIIEVTPSENGCQVRYDATLELAGPLRIFDPALRLFFNRIGDRAAAGMQRVLEGTLV